MNSKQTIESHSSYLTNKRLQILLAAIDQLSLQCSNSMHIHDIMAYYNAVEQMYLNVTSILDDTVVGEIEPLRAKYGQLIDLLDVRPEAQTMKALRILLRMTKQFNFLLVTGLQGREYFFRIATRQSKGLKNIKFFNDSIFNAGGNRNGRETEDAED